MSQYTAEVATQECPLSWVVRVCGQGAFWLGPNDQTNAPPMDVEDVLTMVEVTIDAGSTGKPNFAADKANWATILPLLEQSLQKIRMAQMSDPGMATALENILKETLHRMDDRLDIDDFIPQGQPNPPPPELPKTKHHDSAQGHRNTPNREAVLAGRRSSPQRHWRTPSWRRRASGAPRPAPFRRAHTLAPFYGTRRSPPACRIPPRTSPAPLCRCHRFR